MMKNLLRVITAFIILLAPQANVLAWSVEAHQIVAWIAENRLTPEAQAAVHDLLGGDENNLSDGEFAGWADEIRRQRRDTAPYHYVNIPHDAAGYDAKRDDPESDSIIAMIGRFESVLADKSKSKADRREALLFLVHLIGDLHQPLHVVDRNGDKGGNGRLVFFLDRQKAVKLHEVWDELLVRRYVGRSAGKVGPYSDAIDEQTTQTESSKWAEGSAEDWANESFRLAVEFAYADVPADGPPPKIDQEYVERSKPVVELQLRRAGVRLAVILNRALGESNSRKR